MATTPSLRIVKQIFFKGGTRLYSNRYHFNGGTPADATHWHTLMDAVVTAEKASLSAGVTIVEALGYAAGSDVPVATKTYTTELLAAALLSTALDAAVPRETVDLAGLPAVMSAAAVRICDLPRAPAAAMHVGARFR